MNLRLPAASAVCLALCPWLAQGQTTKTVTVSAPTRLDWKFAASGFGKDAAKLPAGYGSTRQKYQLYEPESYNKAKSWALVLFISPGNGPMGWKPWAKTCEKRNVFFCSPYSAGNKTAAGLRTRIVLDVLDDVRRKYRIDPDQTYLTGFSGGGRMACAIGFRLPEYVGGVIPICGTNPISGPTYLRHLIQDRLSVSFLTGEKDFNRKENEVYMQPMFEELGIRSRLWVVPKLGHAIPSSDIIDQGYIFVARDVHNRQKLAKRRPGVSVRSGQTPVGSEQARGVLETAEVALKNPKTVWRGVVLLQGAVQRWPESEAGQKAAKRLKEIVNNKEVISAVSVQGAQDEQKVLSAQARGFERMGFKQQAMRAWQLLAGNYAGTATGEHAKAQVARLKGEKTGTGGLPRAYLGLAFEPKSVTISQLAPKGPAENAGLKVGDVILKAGKTRIEAPLDLLVVMQQQKPGDKLRLEVRRGDKTLTVELVVGTRPGRKEP